VISREWILLRALREHAGPLLRKGIPAFTKVWHDRIYSYIHQICIAAHAQKGLLFSIAFLPPAFSYSPVLQLLRFAHVLSAALGILIEILWLSLVVGGRSVDAL